MNAHTPKRHKPVIVDLFCGGGGVSEAIRLALGADVTVAINHDPHAIEMHRANHPRTEHYQEDVFKVRPWWSVQGRRVDLLWLSPDCTHFSRARGGKPVSQGVRSLANVAIDWACSPSRPLVIGLENVPEFLTWGPLNEDGTRIKEREGEDFRAWVGALEDVGYVVEWRVLVCADYGDPTSRRRLFLFARCDGQPIVWPEPTHGPGRPHPWRTAAECIDWSIPCPSIFERSRPLAEATQRRIAEGIRRYVVENPKPFLLNLTHGGRLDPLTQPLRTVTAAHLGEKALVAAFLDKCHGSARAGVRIDQPMPTVTGGGGRGGGHAALVAAFLLRYYGEGGQWSGPGDPLCTVTSKDRMGLVTVNLDGEPYIVTDIGMRMLQPRELARAHSFPESYILTGTKSEQVARIGRSVPLCVVEALVRAQFGRAARVAV